MEEMCQRTRHLKCHSAVREAGGLDETKTAVFQGDGTVSA